jgi:aspartyl-tRNA(Asn)/glutamyl-tRNA(Gln) amidotransferase subunit C
MVNGEWSLSYIGLERLPLDADNTQPSIHDLPFTNDMPITESDIRKIAALAHLEITDEELRTLAPQVASIVEYVEQLNGLDTSRVEPAIGGLTPEGERTDAAREDRTRPSLGQALALDQAPDPAHGHFRVPKVIASSEEKENF